MTGIESKPKLVEIQNWHLEARKKSKKSDLNEAQLTNVILDINYYKAEVTIIIDDQLVFHGDMLEKSCKKAKLNYYRVDSGDKILLN